MFTRFPSPVFTDPGSLRASTRATLSVIACATIIMPRRVKSQAYYE